MVQTGPFRYGYQGLYQYSQLTAAHASGLPNPRHTNPVKVRETESGTLQPPRPVYVETGPRPAPRPCVDIRKVFGVTFLLAVDILTKLQFGI